MWHKQHGFLAKSCNWRMAASKSGMGRLDTSKLLACLVEQFGGGINFVCSDLTQCQLSIDFAR